MLGRLDPEAAGLRVCVMQRKVANKVQMIHNQLTGPTTAPSLSASQPIVGLYSLPFSGL